METVRSIHDHASELIYVRRVLRFATVAGAAEERSRRPATVATMIDQSPERCQQARREGHEKLLRNDFREGPSEHSEPRKNGI